MNAFFGFDRNRDSQTDLSEDPVLSALPFIQGADVYVAGSSTPNATVSFQLISRGGGGAVRTLNVPNWEAVGDGVTLQWNDFETLTF